MNKTCLDRDTKLYYNHWYKYDDAYKIVINNDINGALHYNKYSNINNFFYNLC